MVENKKRSEQGSLKDDFLMPIKEIKNFKFDFLSVFITSLIMGQIGILYNLFLAYIKWDNNYSWSILNNCDLLSLSMALLGTYIAMIIVDYRNNDNSYLKKVESVVSLIYLGAFVVTGLVYAILRIFGAEYYYCLRTIALQVIITVFDTFLSIYTLCLINTINLLKKRDNEKLLESYNKSENENMNQIKGKGHSVKKSKGGIKV